MQRAGRGLQAFVCSGGDGVIKVWDTRTDKLVQFYAAHNGPVRDMSFHPSGVAEDGHWAAA